MVAKISIGSSLYGALCYNGEKVNKENGRILGSNKIIIPVDGKADIGQMAENFRLFMPKMGKTKKPVLHISLNPHPDDKLSDQDFEILAREYLDKLGFGEQPYVIYKHEDIDRHHIHIVALRVKPDGTCISDRNNFYRSKDICRELEKKYGLKSAERQKITPDMPIKKIDPNGDIKRQVANTVKMVGMRWKFQSMGEYNAILGLYNVRCEQTDGRVNGREYHGLVYFATDDNGNTIATPFKASRLGKFASRTAIDNRFERAKDKIDIKPTKKMVAEAMTSASGKDDFIAGLKERNIDLVLRYTEDGRIYGATFIDHNTMTVLNGSRIGKEFSANALQRWFDNPEQKPVQNTPDVSVPIQDTDARNDGQASSDTAQSASQQHKQSVRNNDYDDIPSLPGLDLFHVGPGFDSDEEAFYRAMQRRKRKKRRGPKL